MPTPASELFHLYCQQTNRREETLGLSRDNKPPGGITALGIERSGTTRAYCATFQPDGTVFYAGEGSGLEGERTGKVEVAPLWSLLQLLAESDLNSLADSYQYAADFIYESGTLFDAFLLIQSGAEKRVIKSSDGAGTSLVKVALDLLDLLLDQAVWERKPLIINRNPPLQDPRRQKR
ncbi:hypothetical protein [Armatimonas sp.]|uniref:hypothetical protein n=1 Tax=Armatimonas sp. TaxID=1872638 RepID=UPI0037500893